jgi:hypothetical protein
MRPSHQRSKDTRRGSLYDLPKGGLFSYIGVHPQSATNSSSFAIDVSLGALPSVKCRLPEELVMPEVSAAFSF